MFVAVRDALLSGDFYSTGNRGSWILEAIPQVPWEFRGIPCFLKKTRQIFLCYFRLTSLTPLFHQH